MHHPGQGKTKRTLISTLPLKNYTQVNLLETYIGPAPWLELPPLKMASPCNHPLMSSTGVSKCAKSRPEPPAMDDAPSWAGQGWKDPCLNSSPEKLHPSQSPQNSQGTFPMVEAASPKDGKSLPPFLNEQYRYD